ncbi:MAG: glycine--tRNA ligase subunit beta [Caldilineales bacterium]|nr:glycine--tRNA ligase subunit beta [Caldilineales bacterium]MDW8319457.1 glycine--tRNA ligase subunit beta [Anaerolineae bacterium]
MSTHRPPSFQEIIMRLERYWADHGCLIWQPYSEKVGAGTMNPATVLRVLGPEPWDVAYVEPSFRADDGRYGENPNRMQMHTQYQVILKPDPGNPQELYLGSLDAIGIDRRKHDIRFVEDNWASPALGAWGLGWEVWLDGLEITQFTYFQQAGGMALEPVSVELTYGLERIAMFLQGVNEVWKIDWDGRHTYGDIYLRQEVEYCVYNFERADVERLKQMYNLFEAEALNAIRHGLAIPAHDYVLRCSQTFNILDARGAIGVTERASYFARMRDLARQVSELYVEQRQQMGYPFLRREERETAERKEAEARTGVGEEQTADTAEADLLLEIGCEELPVGDVAAAIAQLQAAAPALLAEARLSYAGLRVTGSPRRLVVYVERLAGRQADEELIFRGPPANRAFDAAGQPTAAALGFARSKGVRPEDLVVREADGGTYVFAVSRVAGRPALEVLPDLLVRLVSGLRFEKSMRWASDGIAFSRPIRWFVALFGDRVVPFTYARACSGRVSRGLRSQDSPAIEIPRAEAYFDLMAQHGVVVDRAQRQALIREQVAQLAAQVGGRVPEDQALLDEVTDLVEQPAALLGSFDPRYLELPSDVLITVMKKHQRYFPVEAVEVADRETGKSAPGETAAPADPSTNPPAYQSTTLLPYFITVANGRPTDPDLVRAGNEAVIRARYADAAYFVEHDRSQPLEAFTPKLATLTFQEQLGSMLDKVRRLERLVPWVADRLGLSAEERAVAQRAASLCKSDLATSMVIEMTSLQGIMGREYALSSGEPPAVAEAIFEHYLPRYSGDRRPQTRPGLAVGLANRLDSIAGLFAVGLEPTGSADPFGLRRDALGIVQNLAEAGLSFSVREGLAQAAALLPVPASPEALDRAVAFVVGRLENWLREEGYPFDVVQAVLAARGDDPAVARQTVAALAEVTARPEWPAVLTAYARCKRIVRGVAESYPLAPERDPEPASQALLAAYRAVAPSVRAANDVPTLYAALQSLAAPINTFFDRVLVMAEDPGLRQARLALVQHIAALPDGIADLSLLQGF